MFISTGKELGDIAAVTVKLTLQEEPCTYRQTVSSLDSKQWNEAMKAKINGLCSQVTWELVNLSKGCKVIRCKWVYIVKRNENRKVKCYKARLVAKEFTPVQSIDYKETFTSVTCLESWRYLIALATILDWEIHQIDFDRVYLNGELDQKLYMEQPEGFVMNAGKICHLRKAIYG